jgi:chemotaxis protein CheD
MTRITTMELGQKVVVGVGDYYVTADTEKTLVTYALGSCVGVTAYDPRTQVGGLLHFMLPDSNLNPPKADTRPAMFGDTGLAAFLGELTRLGATKPNLVVKLAGGARSLNGSPEFFNIGERNLILAKRFLWQKGLIVAGEDTGGSDYRTVMLEMRTGRVFVKDPRGTCGL